MHLERRQSLTRRAEGAVVHDVTGCETALGAGGAVGRERWVLGQSSPKPSLPRTTRALYGGRGDGQQIAAFTSSTTFFSTTGLHFRSAYDTGHMSSASRFAASWKPRVEYRYLNLVASWKKTMTLPSAFA